MDEADVIVVGAGGAGLVAAMAAADAGARVLQLEKMPRIGGVWAFRGGTATGAQTRMQFEAGIYGDSPHLFYGDCMRDSIAHKRCDPEVLMYYCQHAGHAVDWLDRLGFYPAEARQPRQGRYGENWSVPRCYYNFEQPFLKVIEPEYRKRVDRGDIEVRTNCRVTGLLQEGRRITGVVAKGADGVERKHRAAAVVVCTGGFGGNPAFVRKYNHPEARMVTTGTPAFAKGDGLVMCEKVGARLVNLEHPVPMGSSAGAVPSPVNPERGIAHVNMNKYPGAIWVNVNGKRVINEDTGDRSYGTREALSQTPEQTLIVILDKRVRDENSSIFVAVPGVPARQWDWFEEEADKGILIKKADTFGELGQMLGLYAEALQNTVRTWNGFVERGEDLEFGRKELGYQLRNPPFYAIKTYPRIVVTSGGPATNASQQVLDITGRVIPGLYVAGEVAGFQGHGTGMFHTGNIVYGKRAGQMAAWEALYGGR